MVCCHNCTITGRGKPSEVTKAEGFRTNLERIRKRGDNLSADDHQGIHDLAGETV